MCSRTICLVDNVEVNRMHSVAVFMEPILPSVSMTFGISTSSPQYQSQLMLNILASSFLLQSDSLSEQTFQILCSRAVDLKLRQSHRNVTAIVQYSLPIMSSVLHFAHDQLIKNMERLLLPHHYDIPTHSYLASTLLRLVDTFGCSCRQKDPIEESSKHKSFDFLAYVRAATSSLQKAKHAMSTSNQDEYYLDPSSVWKAFAIHFRDLVSHFLSSHPMFEIERMMEESYLAEINKFIVKAMNSVDCDHGGQLDAILSPIAKYMLGSEPDPNASFILKTFSPDLSLQSYEDMWIKYVYRNEEFKFKFMIGLLQIDLDLSSSLSQIAGAFHQLAHFLKFQEPLLTVRCYDGAEFLNLVELCDTLKIFRYFSIRHIDILDDVKFLLCSEICHCLQQDDYVVFVINLQYNRYLETSHVSAGILHRAFLVHVKLLHEVIVDKKPSYLFDSQEILNLANFIHLKNGKRGLLSLEAATEILVSEFSTRFRFIVAVDANPQLPISMHTRYFLYKKLRLKFSVCSLFPASVPTTFFLLKLFQQYHAFEAASKQWKQAGLSVAGISVAEMKMELPGYFLLTAAFLNHLTLNSIFENPQIAQLFQRNLEICNMVSVKFIFHLRLFRDQFAFCIDIIQRCLKGINTVIKIHSAADKEIKKLNTEYLEKCKMLESLQAKYAVENNVFEQTLKVSDQPKQSIQSTAGMSGKMRVSSLFSSS
jgi:hypothetical protein